MRILKLGLLMLILSTSIALAAPKTVTPLEIGAVAPDFSLPGIDGKTYTLNSFESYQILVIIFTANHCPTAQAYEDRIIQLVNDFQDQGGGFVAISSNHPAALRLDEMGYTDLGDSFEDMKIRARDKGFNFPYLYDGDHQTMARAYGPQTTPHVFIFDRERKLRFVGRIDDAEKIEKVTTHDTRNAIEALLAGEKVPVAKTRTFGCSLKWAYKKASAQKAIEKWNAEPVALTPIDLPGIKKLLQNDSENLRLINIWATWCGPCLTEFPELIEINRMYRHRNFEMVTLSTDEPGKAEQVMKFLHKQHASTKNYQYQGDKKYPLIEAVDPNWPGALPYTLLIKPGGEIIYKKQGVIEPLELKRAIVAYVGRYFD